MDHARCMGVGESGRNLLKIKQRLIDWQRPLTCQRSHVAARHVFDHDVMKSCACEINGGAVSEPADYVWMTHTIQSDCLVLKILNQRALQIQVGRTLQESVKRFNDHCGRSTLSRGVVPCYIDFGIAAASQTFNDVVATVEPALL